MAGAAGGPAGHVLPVVGLCRLCVVVTLGAVAQVLREPDFGVVMLAVAEAPDGVALAKPFFQVLAGVDLVGHFPEVEHVAAVGIGVARVVAQHAELRIDTPATVQPEFLMALIATGDVDHLVCRAGACDCHGIAAGIDGEVEIRIDPHRRAGRVGVAQLDCDAVGGRRIPQELGGIQRVGRRLDIGAESISIVTGIVIDQRTYGLRVGRGMLGGGQRGRAAWAFSGSGRLGAVDVVHPLVRSPAGAGDQLGDDEAHVAQGQVLLHRAVGNHREIDLGRAVHGHRRHAGIQHDRKGGGRIGRRVVGSNCRSGGYGGTTTTGGRGRGSSRVVTSTSTSIASSQSGCQQARRYKTHPLIRRPTFVHDHPFVPCV